MLLDHEIAEERSVEHLDRWVLAPGGTYVRVTHVCKTVPLPVWRLSTSSHTLECAANHLVVTDRGTLPVDHLRLSDLVMTEDGAEPIVLIEDLEEERELYDLRVESDDHLYFTGGIASHNSTGLGAAELFKFSIVPNYGALYITPLKEQNKTIADKLMDMQRGSLFPPDYFTKRQFRNNMYYKESPNGGSLKLLHVLTDPSKIRGNSVPTVVVDECVTPDTPITTPCGCLPLRELSRGNSVLAFDQEGVLRLDHVKNIVDKGIRHTWRFVTRGGREITCTGNERLRTPAGWRYASEFIQESAASVCETALKAKQIGQSRAGHGAGHPSGRRKLSDIKGSVSSLQSATLSEAAAVLPGQDGPATGLLRRENSTDPRTESRVGHRVRSVLDTSNSDLRVFALPVLRRGGSEDRYTGVGGSSELAHDSVVVHGRRRAASGPNALRNPRFYEDRSGSSRCQNDEYGGRGETSGHEERSQVGSPHPTVAKAERENSPLRAREHALQITACAPAAAVPAVPKRDTGGGGPEVGLLLQKMQGPGRLREIQTQKTICGGENEGAENNGGSHVSAVRKGVQDAEHQRAGKGILLGQVPEESQLPTLEEDEIVAVYYAGAQRVFDVETERHHTLFAGGLAVHNCQDFDPEHLPEINQVQKNFRNTRSTIFAGTSKDLDTCLEQQYRLGSGGVWHIPCGCKDKFHSMDPDDTEMIKAYLSVDGLRCPHDKSRKLNPMTGEFVHERPSRLRLNMPSFHLPQVVVPEYAQGAGFVDIWKDYLGYPWKKFLMEVWGIAVESGMVEISERDLKKCCTEYTFAQTQKRYFEGKQRYVKVISGVDWGGSDWEPAYRSKLSYTVHTIWGMKGDGTMDLLYARRYEGMNYQEIAGTIVEKHLEFGAFAIGTDNGGGLYYNAYLRDSGRIPLERIIHFQYTDTKLVLARIPSDVGINLMSLHRTDSISALIADVKDQKLTWPRWDESAGFAMDFLNTRRNITEAPSGKTIMRFIKHGAKADDFMMSANYACMMKRIINRESLIPNQQIMDELRQLFGIAIPNSPAARMGDFMDGGYVSG